MDVAGVRSTKGSPIYADRVPGESSYSVEILEGNGAVVIGKSNTPEFGAGANTFNEVFGKTRNPWDTRMTCGGSSGGSAVALASGQVWLATGSDLGGSLRIPASFCSVVGLRPSPGRVPEGPKAFPFETLSVDGPMGRTVGDVALMLDAEAGHHPGDPLSYSAPETSYVEAVDNPESPTRIAYTPDLGIAPVAREVKDLCARAVRLFEGMATVDEDTIDLHDARDTFQTLRAAQFAANMRPLLGTHRDWLKPEVIWNIEKGMALDRRDVEKAQAARGALFHRVTTFFQKYDLLVCPTVSVPPFDVDIPLPDGGGRRSDGQLRRLASPDLRTDPHGLPCHLRPLRVHGVGASRRVAVGRPTERRGSSAIRGSALRGSCGTSGKGPNGPGCQALAAMGRLPSKAGGSSRP